MNDRIELGRIQSIKVGLGGYQDVQIGVWVTLGGKSWAVGAGEGAWSMDPDERSQWTAQDRLVQLGQIMLRLCGWLKQAKVDSAEALVGIPVEVTFKDYNVLKSWRILEEVL